jgi:putative component of membrane protein insertase Oxa1/YidC/SpoIIIJ protein YidD
MTTHAPVHVVRGSSLFRRAATQALRALACIPVGAIYAVVLVLIRLSARSEQRGPRAERGNAPLQERQARIGVYIIRGCVVLYRFSLVHDLMHRDGERCMFLPSCSEYADRAALKYGFRDALMMIGDRFRRCRADTTEDFVDFP